MIVFVVCFISWFIAQLMKVIINSTKYVVAKKKGKTVEKVTLATLFKLGGMPSSHTATVIALAASMGLKEGWTSDAFAIFSSVISLICRRKCPLPSRSLCALSFLKSSIILEIFRNC